MVTLEAMWGQRTLGTWNQKNRGNNPARGQYLLIHSTCNVPICQSSTLCTPLDKLPSHKHKNVEIVESYHVQSTLCVESTVNFFGI